MTTWKYTDADNRVVSRTLENGGIASCLVTAQEVQDWIAAGNTPLPYVAPPVDRKAELISQISILDIKRIRPIAEGDTEYLAILNSQIKTLRDELKTL